MPKQSSRPVLMSFVSLAVTVVAGCSSAATHAASGEWPNACQTPGAAQVIGPLGYALRTFTFVGSRAVVTAKGITPVGQLGPSTTVLVYLGPTDRPPTIFVMRDPPKIEGATITIQVTDGQPALETLPSGDYWAATVPYANLTIQPCQGSSVSNVALLPKYDAK